jgi:hypothetical protein
MAWWSVSWRLSDVASRKIPFPSIETGLSRSFLSIAMTNLCAVIVSWPPRKSWVKRRLAGAKAKEMSGVMGADVL